LCVSRPRNSLSVEAENHFSLMILARI